MATASPCGRWSWSRSAIKPFSSSSSSPCNPLIFVSFQISPRERRRLATFSVQNSSRPDPDAGKSRLRKSIATDLSSSRSIASGDGVEGEVGEMNLVKFKNPKKRSLTFKSLFGKKQLWRRILFASNKVRSLILLNVITVVYASNIPVVKEVEAIMDPAAFTVVRFTVSAIPFIPFVARSWNNTHTRNAGIELGVWVSLGYLMQALGLLTSDAGRASFLSMFTVIMVPLLDGMLGAVVPAYTWLGALVSILGVGMLESSGSPPCVGDLLNFLSAVFFGVHMLRTEHVSRNTNKNEFLSLLGYEICVVALFSTMWYFFGGWFGGAQPSDPSSWTWEMIWNWMVVFPWIPALYSGVFSTGLCLWIEMDAMRDVSATEAAIIYGLEPVWGGAFAWFLLGERWGTTGWIGAALVLGGSLTVQIIGSSSSSKSSKDKESDEEGHNILTTSPVVVSSRKDVDVYRK